MLYLLANLIGLRQIELIATQHNQLADTPQSTLQFA
jgi:hypothetical protein